MSYPQWEHFREWKETLAEWASRTTAINWDCPGRTGTNAYAAYDILCSVPPASSHDTPHCSLFPKHSSRMSGMPPPSS